MIDQILSFLLAKRVRAGLFAAVMGFVPLLGWMASVLVALVTLEKGALEGGGVLLWAMLPYVISSVVFNNVTGVVSGALGGVGLTFLLALLFRRGLRWQYVIERSVLLSILAILLVVSLFPSVNHQLVSYIQQYMLDLGNAMGKGASEASGTMALISRFQPYFLGILLAMSLASALFNVVIARMLQTRRVDLSRWSSEWCDLRLGIFFAALLLLSSLLVYLGWEWGKSFLPVLIMAFALAGVSAGHKLLRRSAHAKFLLILFYVGISVLPIFPMGFIIMLVGLIALALGNTVFHIFLRRS